MDTSSGLSERGGAAPEYGPLGLNHTLRIEGRSYFYDPELGTWERGNGPASTADMPLHVNAESIHTWMQQGYRVLPWTEDAR